MSASQSFLPASTTVTPTTFSSPANPYPPSTAIPSLGNMRTKGLFVILGLGSIASHVSAVPNTRVLRDVTPTRIHASYVIPRMEHARDDIGTDKDTKDSGPVVPRPAEPEPPHPPSPRFAEPQPQPSLAAPACTDPNADESRALRVRVHRGTELVYDPIDSTHTEISTAPWWAPGEEGLSWKRDEVTGELVPQSQTATARADSLHGANVL